ncbi:MAG: hypothetical protein ACRDUY_00540 [Nitriliruptorales bacterium]
MRSGLSVVGFAAVLAASCASSPDAVAWNDLHVDVPEGWHVSENDPGKLSLANAPLGRESSADDLEAAIFFTVEESPSLEPWREIVAERDGEVEEDTGINLAGVDADRIVFTTPGNGTPMREMVVVVPARDLVILLQPVVLRESTEGPAIFDRYRPVFEDVLSSITWQGQQPVGAFAPVPVTARR